MAPKVALREEFGAVVGALQTQHSERGRAKKVLLVGQRGAGKTRFLHFLDGIQGVADDKPDNVKISELHARARGEHAQTTDATATDIGLGQDTALLNIVDVPGWQDTTGTQSEGMVDQEHNRQLRAAAVEAGLVDCVVLVVNGACPRTQSSIDDSLRTLGEIYPIEELRDRVIVLFTFVDCLQKREFPVTQDGGIVGDLHRREAERQAERQNQSHEDERRKERKQEEDRLFFHLDNPLSRLEGMAKAGLTEEDLLRELAEDDDDESRGREIRREVRKGAQELVRLLKRVSDMPKPLFTDATLGAGVIERLMEWRQASVRAVLVAKDEAAESALKDATADESEVRTLASARAEVAKEPDRFPILVSRAPGRVDLPDVEMKLKVKGDMLVGQLQYILRMKVSRGDGQADPNQTYYMMSGDTALMTSWNMHEVYHKLASEDGFLRLSYTAETTLGAVRSLEHNQ